MSATLIVVMPQNSGNQVLYERSARVTVGWCTHNPKRHCWCTHNPSHVLVFLIGGTDPQQMLSERGQMTQNDLFCTKDSIGISVAQQLEILGVRKYIPALYFCVLRMLEI